MTNHLAVLVLLSLVLGASAIAHLRQKQSSEQSVTPVCAENQRDHLDGGCPRHKKNGGCSVANPQHLAWRVRCPESCGMCIPAAAFKCSGGVCAAWAVTNGPCSASNLADPSPAQCAAAVKLVGGWGAVTSGAWDHVPSGCSASGGVHPHYNAKPNPAAPNYGGFKVVCVRPLDQAKKDGCIEGGGTYDDATKTCTVTPPTHTAATEAATADQAKKEGCTEGGGTYDDATKTCTVTPPTHTAATEAATADQAKK